MAIHANISRRQFVIRAAVAGGGLVLGFYLPFRESEAAPIAAQPWTSPEQDGHEINAWLVIGADDTVTIRVAQSEMGEGVFTSMPMIIAEELECDWSKVRAEYASANRSLRENRVYQRLATGGSGAVRRSREYLQQAGASTRARLIAAAAQQWGVPASACKAENSMVVHAASGRRVTYGAIAAAAAKVKLEAEPAIKTPEQFKLLGKPQQRLDVPPKVNGTATFGMDVRLPDMLYAAVMTCPVFGGNLKRHDFNAIKNMPGVQAAIEIPNGIAVVANSFWRAKTALEAMPVEWELGEFANTSSEALRQTFHAVLDDTSGVVASAKGDALAALDAAAQVVEADYDAPYLAHATMEPMNCTAHVTPERADVWVGTQNPEGALAATAELTGVAPENVYVHNCFLGGGFGRRFYNDEVRQAVTVAKAVGRPVKLIWTREEDMRHDFYRPMSALRFRAALDANGMPTALFNRSVTHSILSWFRPDAVRDGVDRTSVEGLTNMPYQFAHHRMEHRIHNTPVPAAFWRSVGSSQNGFAVESFLDELAHAGGKDPVELRRLLLKEHPDWLHVLNTVAEKANWGKAMPPGMAQGFAIHESFGTIVGEVAEVAVSKGGDVRVERVVCAVDCGHVVNPLTVEEQMESGIVYGLTAALYGQITIAQGRVVERNFDSYRMLRIDHMPEVETHLALTGGSKWGGIGEPGVPPIAPAVCNAIFKITGKRIRSLPLMNHDLSWS